jgi:16S rRNA processing protein RimM
MADGPEASWLAVGRVRRPHGVHGEVAVETLTDFPERLVAGVEIGLGQDAPEFQRVVHRVRFHKGDWLLSFVGAFTREDVEGWRGLWVFLPAQERSKLPANYYYEHELVGCRCVLADGTALGDVTDLQTSSGTSLLAVATEGGEVLVPFAAPIVVKVDLAARAVVVDPPRGLFDDDAL